jgi:cellulose biosynthesis protein BcsQ
VIPVIAFFNNKGGVGKTTLVYHVAWKLADMGFRVLAADIDPQANLTEAFLDEDGLEEIWPEPPARRLTIFGSLKPLIQGIADVEDIPPLHVNPYLDLIPGDIALSSFEDEFSAQWPNCLVGQPRAFRVTSAIWRIMQRAASRSGAQVILMDLAPSLGAINRAALISADFIVFPLIVGPFSLLGLRHLGDSVREWRAAWKSRLEKSPEPSSDLPKGDMKPAGYVVLRHELRLDRPVQLSTAERMAYIPYVYVESVLGAQPATIETPDPNRIAVLKDYRNLMPMAQEARKPIFHLKPADGALGAHLTAANAAGKEFEALARELMFRAGLLPVISGRARP